MNSPFKITLKKEIPNNTINEEILNSFKTNLKRNSFDTFNKTENQLTASNDFISTLNGKLWVDKEKVIITILEKQNKKEINYTLDFKGLFKDFKIALASAPFGLLYIYIKKPEDLFFNNFFIGLISIIVFFIFIHFILFIFLFFRHRYFFKNTLKYGAGNVKYYNWDEILKNKSLSELKTIIKTNRDFPEDVRILAEKELNRRNLN